jgi:CheY-like chemotaxis protein
MPEDYTKPPDLGSKFRGQYTITHKLYFSCNAVCLLVKHLRMVGKNQGCDNMKDKIQILIIEDEPGVSMMMVYLLTQAGCEAVAAWSAEEGMRLAQDGKFDLITLEVDLPGMNGFEVCRQLKDNPRSFDTPVVFVAWRDSLEDQQRGLELGAADYITKPFEPIDFISRIVSQAEAKKPTGRSNCVKRQPATIVQPGLGKLPASDQIEIGNRFYSAEDFSETSLPNGRPKRGPDKAFRSRVRDAVAIPDWPANPGLCSSRAIGALLPTSPATSLFSCAIFAPASRSNSLRALSPQATVAGALENIVFTHTQLGQTIQRIFACIGLDCMIRL